jgi:ABC-type glycerol-3-phosphate transport system permease component
MPSRAPVSPVASRVILFAILAALALTTLYPIVFVGLTTFKERGEYIQSMFGLPRALFFGNFAVLFDRFNILRIMLNSFIITSATIALSLVVSSMAAFSFAKLPFRGSSTVFVVVIASMMIPGQVLMIPVYLMMSRLGLVNTHFSVILFYTTTSLPFAVYFLTANMRSIPDELVESARIDGASPPRIYAGLMIPMSLPTVMTLTILTFLSCWNELLYAMLFLQKESVKTLTLATATLVGRYTTNIPLMMTGLFVNCIPVIIVFVFFQKYVVRGVTMGAVKG